MNDSSVTQYDGPDMGSYASLQFIPTKAYSEQFLARLHEVHRAIVVTSVVRIYVYVYLCVRVSHFRLKFLKLLYLDSH